MTERQLGHSFPVRTLDRIRHLEDISSEWAWGEGTGKGIRVGVIDSGIDEFHPAIDGRVQGYVALTLSDEGLIHDIRPHQDDHGHGTACAGIIRSIAPDCDLYSIKVLGSGLSGRGAVFAAGLEWAIENKMHICNLSLGTTKKDFYAVFHELTDRAYFHNIMLVTAAHNLPVCSFPSLYSSVISVSSHSKHDPYCFYYNPEPPVEFASHGVDVRVAWRHGGWLTATGNSFAAPHMTGLVARILSKHPGLTVFQMKSILKALAANIAPISHDVGTKEI